MKLSLTYQQKQQLYDEYKRRIREEQSVNQTALAEWAQNTFHLPARPSQTTVSRILKKQSTNPIPRSHYIHKRDRTGHNYVLEQALFGWVCDQLASRINITGRLIREKGLQLQGQANQRLASQKQFNMHFSQGWLGRFQNRWGLKARGASGEDGDADDEASDKGLPHLKEVIKGFALEDVWNADECGLNYRLAPSRTISRAQLSSREKDGGRISALVCCNADGSEKMPLMLIGNARKPHCFKAKTGLELGYDYHNNAKAWMTSALFFDWLCRFNEYISRTKDRRVLLLIDNCSAHGTEGTLPRLTNVKIVFLPPNATSNIQPGDAGIIAALKMRYRRMRMERVLDLIDVGARHIYQLDQLTGMRWMTTIWEGLEGTVIKNSWQHTGLMEDDVLEVCQESLDLLLQEKEQLQDMIEQVVGRADRMSLEKFINHEDEAVCTEMVTDTNLVDVVVESLREEEGNNVEASDVDVDGVCLPDVHEQLKSLAMTKHIVEARFPNQKELIDSLKSIQKELRKDHLRDRR